MNIFDKVPNVHKDAFVAPSASVIGDVQIGQGSSIWYGCVLRGKFMIQKQPEHNYTKNVVLVHKKINMHSKQLQSFKHYTVLVDSLVCSGWENNCHGGMDYITRNYDDRFLIGLLVSHYSCFSISVCLRRSYFIEWQQCGYAIEFSIWYNLLSKLGKNSQ